MEGEIPSNPIQFRAKPQEVPVSLLHLLDMRDVEKLGQILMDLEWSLEEEVTKTVEVARKGSGKERLVAMDRLRKLQAELLEENGLIVTQQQEISRDANGSIQSRGTTFRRIVARKPLQLSTPAVVDLTPQEGHGGTDPSQRQTETAPERLLLQPDEPPAGDARDPAAPPSV